MPEEARPIVERAGVVRHQPVMKRAVRGAQLADAARIEDHRLDFQPVAHDAGIGEEPRDIGRVERGHKVDVEAAEGGAERLALFEDSQPRQAGLIDLQHEPLEQYCLVLGREPVFAVVIGTVQRMRGGGEAIGGAHRAMIDDGALSGQPAESRKLSQGELTTR